MSEGDNDRLWRTKLKAWTHDPAEKALVLLRDPTGHEHGTVKALQDEMRLADVPLDKRCDRWAAAADRPQFPREANDRYATWAQVRFADAPVLIHPLFGKQYDLGKLQIEPAAIKAVSFAHFKDYISKTILFLPTVSLTRELPSSPSGASARNDRRPVSANFGSCCRQTPACRITASGRTWT